MIPPQRIVLALLACLLATPASPAADAARPNFLFIMADDLGWRDLGCAGSTFFETPRIDALAAGGMRFTRAYSPSTLCSPARASILSGIWPGRHGLTLATHPGYKPSATARLEDSAAPDRKTLEAVSASVLDASRLIYPELLRAGGYRTAHIGKWHIGTAPNSPLEQGFETDIPHTNFPSPMPDGFFHPWPTWPGQGKPGDHLEDRMAEEAVKFLDSMRGTGQPFYLQYWMWQVHSPWQAKPEDLARHEARVNPDEPQRNPVMAAMIQNMDENVGKVLDALDRNGFADNTVVIFTSDNGGVVFPYKEYLPDRWKGVPVTSNLPLRSGKGTLFEGGIRVPLIVKWSRTIKPGSLSGDPVTLLDLYPTILDLAGIPRPAEPALDGDSLLPVFGGRSLGERTLAFHFPHRAELENLSPSSALIRGNWKLIRYYADNPDRTDRLALFDLAEDIGEKTDLSAREPERAAEMNTLLQSRLAESDAILPIPNPAFQPKPRQPQGTAKP